MESPRPLREARVLCKLDGREYSLRVFAPHDFAVAIATADPGASNRYAVNLGAGDGVSCNDPALPLYQCGYSGLAIEGGHSTELLANLPSPDIVKLIDTMITPDGIVGLLSDHGCPEDPDFLKLDIDGYDGPVLQAILASGLRPKVLQLEVQPEFPPPLSFAVLHHPDYRNVDAQGMPSGFYGMSLAHACALGRRYGYHAVQVDFVTPFTHDVTMVVEGYVDVVRERFGLQTLDDRELWLAHPPGWSHFGEQGIDSLSWRHRQDFHSLLPQVWNACVTACAHKHGRLLPFALSID